MALAFSASNLLQFYTFISPIFISLFLLLKSTMEYNMKGIVYIIGVLINYVIGMLIKTIFYGMDRSKISSGQQPQWQRTPVKMGWPMHPLVKHLMECRITVMFLKDRGLIVL